MDNIKIGSFIYQERKRLGFTQQMLAEKLGISFQAVSKWETGETLPDVSILLNLADILNTTVDKILNGGTYVLKKDKRINVNEIVEAFNSFNQFKDVLGDTLYYEAAIDGINNKMNIDIENDLKDISKREVHYTEAIIQLIMKGYIVDIEDVRKVINNDKMINIIIKYNNR